MSSITSIADLLKPGLPIRTKALTQVGGHLAAWQGLVLILLWLWAFPGVVIAAPVLPPQQLDQQLPHLLLDGHLAYFKDATQKMTFDEARAAYQAGQFVPLKGDSITAGNLTGHAVWGHFSVTVLANDANAWWLLVAPEHIDHITLFLETTEGHVSLWEGGRNRPFEQRGFPSPGHAFRLGPLPEGTQQVYLRMTANAAVKIEPSLWQEAPLIRYLTGVNTGFGAYFGLAGLLWLMALARTVMFRNNWDLAYLGYLTGFEMFHFINSGLIEAWGLSSNLELRDTLMRIGIMLTGFSFVALVRTLIVWPTPPRWLEWTAVGGLAGVMLWLLVTRIVRSDLFPEINLLTGVGLLVAGTLAGIWAAYRNYPHARVMILCFLPFVLWIVFLILMRYSDAVGMDAWQRQRIMMITSIAHMFALWLLAFSKDARLQAAKRRLESEVTLLQNEMAQQSWFLSVLTHEMNRPIQRLVEIVRRSDNDTSPVATLRPTLHAIGTEMNGVMETCLDRIRQASSQTLQRQSTDVGRLAESIVNHFRQANPQRLITSEVQGLPAWFDCDSKLVAILLSNLLENAIRHSPEGGSIHIMGQRIDPATIELRVADEGPGIPDEARGRIFDRYVQLNPDATGAPTGMGLGLFIVRRIAELHGGDVSCISELGVGSQFVVRLKSAE